MALQMIRWSVAIFGACLAALLLGAAPAAAQPAVGGTASSGAPDWSPKTDVHASYSEAAGQLCTGGSGVTVCPTLLKAGDPAAIRGVIGTIKGKELKLSFCVSTDGVPEDVEVSQSTGKIKADKEMQKFIRTYRYTPGTVNGAPARLCGVVAAFKF
jgi:hypothetical protein